MKLMPITCIFRVKITTKFVCFYFCCLIEKTIYKKLFILHNNEETLFYIIYLHNKNDRTKNFFY